MTLNRMVAAVAWAGLGWVALAQPSGTDWWTKETEITSEGNGTIRMRGDADQPISTISLRVRPNGLFRLELRGAETAVVLQGRWSRVENAALLTFERGFRNVAISGSGRAEMNGASLQSLKFSGKRTEDTMPFSVEFTSSR